MSPRRAVAAAAVVPLLTGCGSYHARHAWQARVAANTLLKRVGWLRCFPHGHHHSHLLRFQLYQLPSAAAGGCSSAGLDPGTHHLRRRLANVKALASCFHAPPCR